MLYELPMFRETTEYPWLTDDSETCSVCDGQGIEYEGSLEGWQMVCVNCNGSGYSNCSVSYMTHLLSPEEVEESMHYASLSDYPNSLEYAE